jgi:hypothetical protein
LQGSEHAGRTIGYSIQAADGNLFRIVKCGPARRLVGYWFCEKVDRIAIEHQFNGRVIHFRERVDEIGQLGFMSTNPESTLAGLGLATQVEVGNDVDYPRYNSHDTQVS